KDIVEKWERLAFVLVKLNLLFYQFALWQLFVGISFSGRVGVVQLHGPLSAIVLRQRKLWRRGVQRLAVDALGIADASGSVEPTRRIKDRKSVVVGNES